MAALKPWHEWEMPPLWVCAVTGLVLIGISTLVLSKVSETMSSSARQAIPAPTPAAPNPKDPDSY